jgi:hypothetical protein
MIFSCVRQEGRKSGKGRRGRKRERKKGRRKTAKRKIETRRRKERRKKERINQGEMKWRLLVLIWWTPIVQKIREKRKIKERSIRGAIMTQMM